MGIVMRYPGTGGVAAAVDEAQADYYEAKGWVRLTADELVALEAASVAAENAILIGGASTQAEAVEQMTEVAVAEEVAELAQHTNDELRAIAAERGIAVPSSATKAELIAAIEARAPTEEP